MDKGCTPIGHQLNIHGTLIRQQFGARNATKAAMTYIGRNQWDLIVCAALLFGCIYGSDVLVHANPFSHRAPSQVWLSLHVCTRAPGPPVSGPCITLYIYICIYMYGPWPMAIASLPCPSGTCASRVGPCHGFSGEYSPLPVRVTIIRAMFLPFWALP